MKEFKNRVAVVTGAASGIGLAISACFAAEGMKLVMVDIDKAGLEVAVEKLHQFGATISGIAADVSKGRQVEALAKEVQTDFGGVHLLVNNAGVGYDGFRSWETPLQVWDWIINVNLMSVVHGIHYFLPIMQQQAGDCHIVNTASSAGLIYNGYGIPYSVSKHGAVALTESLYLELQACSPHIGVSLLCPGVVNTKILESSARNRPDQIPAPPLGTNEEAVFAEAQKKFLEKGSDPKSIAEQVLDAIKNRRFYILPSDEYDQQIEQRMLSILQRANPKAHGPSREFIAIFNDLLDKSRS